MEITLADAFLLGWAVVATILYAKRTKEMNMFGSMTVEHFRSIAKGEMTVIDTGESIKFIRKENQDER